MFFSSIKGINRLISKGMSNIYLELVIEKNRFSQNFDFLSLKNLSPNQFLERSVFGAAVIILYNFIQQSLNLGSNPARGVWEIRDGEDL